MIKYIKYAACFLLLFSCAENSNLPEDFAFRGGYAQFTTKPILNFNILDIDNEKVIGSLIDPNNNITNYSLALHYNGTVVENIAVLTSFPAALEIPLSTIIAAAGLTSNDINLSTKFTLVATITTPTGVFSGLSPIDGGLGGNTSTRLKNPEFMNAVEFDITFFLPPAKTIRRTSFEEVAVGANDAVYTRNGGEDETLDLINGVNPPFVDFIAAGSSVENELGFNSEYVASPGISSSSLGFSSERIGVTASLENFVAYPDGKQGFHSEDADGTIKITFDTVNVPAGQANSGVSFQAFFGDTSWEEKDGIVAYLNVTKDSGNEVIEIVRLFDDDIENIAGKWNEFNTGFLKNIRSYQLVIEISSGATPEYFYIDNVIFYEPLK
tara:strand:- start:931 stop:2076 length:1146 start_codon:yes stop_codon:yes gene_type:complete